MVLIFYGLFIIIIIKTNIRDHKFSWAMTYKKMRMGLPFPSDDAFSTGIGLERAGFDGPVRWLWVLDSSAKTRNKKDRRGLARCRFDA